MGLRKVELPSKAVVWRGCTYENAVPILQKFGYPALVFVVFSQADGYNDCYAAFGFSRRHMIMACNISALDRSDVVIGSHTANLFLLCKIEMFAVTNEVWDSNLTMRQCWN
jgi:hypothetical protein